MDLSKGDLTTLIGKKDHLNVLRYIRVFQLRKPHVVVEHGKEWLGPDLSKGGGVNAIVRQTALEQIALAALDIGQPKLAEKSLDQLKICGVPSESIRFRRLLGRCLEAAGDQKGARLIYQDLTQDSETPANLSALKRLYALEKAMPQNEVKAHEALVKYLQKHPSDPAAWYELAQARQALGDYLAAAYCLEECMLSAPLEPALHTEMAECYMTHVVSLSGNEKKQDAILPTLLEARQHMAQALELDGTCTRAAWGLLQCSNMYLLYSSAVTTSSTPTKETSGVVLDSFQGEVARALMEHAASVLTKNYKGQPMEVAVNLLVKDFLEE